MLYCGYQGPQGWESVRTAELLPEGRPELDAVIPQSERVERAQSPLLSSPWHFKIFDFHLSEPSG